MFQVTVHDPCSEHPELTDERFECESFEDLASRIESVTEWTTFDARSIACAVSDGEAFEEDIERGDDIVTVTAKQVERVGAVG